MAIAIGLIPWLWAGSYIGFREFHSDPISPSMRVVHLPSWALPMESSYAALSEVDRKVTGTTVLVSTGGWSTSCWQ